MSFPWRLLGSLHARVMAMTGLMATMLLVVLVHQFYQNERQEYEAQLMTRAQLQADLLASSVAQAMWDFNNLYIHQAVKGLLDDPEIERVTIYDAKGHIMESMRDDEARLAPSMQSTLRSPIRYEASGTEEPLGTLEIVISKKRIESRLHQYLRDAVFEAAAFLVLLLLLMYGSIHILIGPLRAITKAMLALACGQMETAIPSQSRRDEIGRMARAIQIFKDTALRESELSREAESRQLLLQSLEREKARAEASNRAKSLFLANMSHEIRTPMSGILGMVHLLLDTAVDETQREYIGTIRYSAQNLLLLLNGILDLSKIESEELIIEQKPFDPCSEFLHTLKLLKPLIGPRKLRLRSSIGDPFPPVMMGDSGRFIQLITNLVGNALKFTESGTVDVRLGYDFAAGRIRCDIVDTGIGIDVATQAKLFEKFTQGDSSISRRYGGTGLGLAITKQLVLRMGGDIGFESEKGRGSHFWFELPMAVADPDEANAEEGGQCSIRRQRLPVEQARILVVEDQPVNQLFLMKMLRKFGFRNIESADDGEEALRKVRDARFDAIFMDCQMPRLDGYEATRCIRQWEAEAGELPVVIVAMTANAMIGDKEICLKAGMDEYQSKPLDPETLKSTLRQWFILPSDVEQAGADFRMAAPPVDRERLRIVADDEEEERQLLALFFTITAEKLTALGHARRHSELSEWRATAHNLKGAAANLGMNEIVSACGRAEISTEHSYQEATHMIEAIRLAAERAANYLGYE